MESTPFATFIREVWPDIESPEALELEFRKSYPGIDLLGEARRAYQWEQTARRKKRLHQRFLTNWLNRCAANRYAVASRGVYTSCGPGTPEYQKALEEAKATAGRRIEQTQGYIRRLGAQQTTPPSEARTKIADILKKLGNP